jgi:hypothetical protein
VSSLLYDRVESTHCGPEYCICQICFAMIPDRKEVKFDVDAGNWTYCTDMHTLWHESLVTK